MPPWATSASTLYPPTTSPGTGKTGTRGALAGMADVASHASARSGKRGSARVSSAGSAGDDGELGLGRIVGLDRTRGEDGPCVGRAVGRVLRRARERGLHVGGIALLAVGIAVHLPRPEA